MFRFIAYGILLALLLYNAYFHFNGSNLLPELFNNNNNNIEVGSSCRGVSDHVTIFWSLFPLLLQLPSSLPPGVTAADACRTLKSKYNLNMQSLLQASPSIQHYWEQLQCSTLTPLTRGGSKQDRNTAPIFSNSEKDAMGNIVPEQQPTDMKETTSTTPQTLSDPTQRKSSHIRTESRIDVSSSSSSEQNLVLNNAPITSTEATSPVILESMVRARCKKLRDKYGVQPGKNWGTLPLGRQPINEP